jgi:hypothetical protein
VYVGRDVLALWRPQKQKHTPPNANPRYKICNLAAGSAEHNIWPLLISLERFKAASIKDNGCFSTLPRASFV